MLKEVLTYSVQSQTPLVINKHPSDGKTSPSHTARETTMEWRVSERAGETLFEHAPQ